MALATHASLTLVRFDDMHEIGPVEGVAPEGTLFFGAGSDVRAAGTEGRSQQAFKFAVYGLHQGEASARRAKDDRVLLAPWLAEAQEVWSAVLLPFRHFGEANYLGRPGPLFEVQAPPPPEGTPIVIATSVGWDTFEGEAWERIKRFGDNVAAVRMGMTGLQGLHSQQTFSFPGGPGYDGLTVTLWRDVASAMAFAYGPGLHRKQVKVQREELYGDRTSFTRFVVLESEGTWHGTDPLVR